MRKGDKRILLVDGEPVGAINRVPAENDARRQMREIVAAGKAEGLIVQDADADVLFDMIVGTLVFRLMFSSTERPADHLETLVDQLCRSLAPQPDGE